jgi:hypothetical protein
VKISTQKLGDKVADILLGMDVAAGGQSLHVFQRRDKDVAERDDLCLVSALLSGRHIDTYVLMAEMFE